MTVAPSVIILILIAVFLGFSLLLGIPHLYQHFKLKKAIKDVVGDD